MIARDMAIPLAIHPYSTTSRVVRWLTRRHGKIGTALKGALRPKSPFLGEYELFGTSELLFHTKRVNTLFAAKECALLHRRPTFRSNWRAMRSASYLTVLFDRAAPEEAPQPELFLLLEDLLDQAEVHGADPRFIPWAELHFCAHLGHAPQLEACVMCGSLLADRFCAAQGGLVCGPCAREHQLAPLPCPPADLRALKTLSQARTATHTPTPSAPSASVLNITGAFITHHFNLNPSRRAAALHAA